MDNAQGEMNGLIVAFDIRSTNSIRKTVFESLIKICKMILVELQ